MGQHEVTRFADPKELRVFTQHVLRDLRALECMIAEGRIETGVRRIGIEQEMFLVDRAWRPAPVAQPILKDIDDPRFTTELARFNLEVNLEPILLEGDCFSRMEKRLHESLAQVRAAAHQHGAEVVLSGILPTIREADLNFGNMTPLPRYFALNEAIKGARGAEFELHVIGKDEINIRHDNVMLEACNTSCQVHFQVDPGEFARLYNITQAAAGPILSACCNSPLLFGRRLWSETRIAVFQQSVDTRIPGSHAHERCARVAFGSDWIRESVLEIYEEDVTRFRTILGSVLETDSFEELAAGRVPRLDALALHNGTVYRWNRPCYGVHEGKPHLRIENRILPAGPTVIDEVANAALWIGLVSGLASVFDDITKEIDFDSAKLNFILAARSGLDAQLTWLGGRRVAAPELLSGELLPLARTGLLDSGVSPGDVDRYIGVIEQRVDSGNTGAEWQLRSFAAMEEHGTLFERARAIVAAMSDRQRSGRPVHEWSTATVGEAGGWRHNFQRVGQYMTTDVFVVHRDEVVDLIANVMAWRNVRHVPVEDEEHRLVGLVSYQSLLDFLARELSQGRHEPTPVSEIMEKDPLSVAPETPTLEAIEIMRREGVACLPVVKDDRLMGIITEHDFMTIAAHLLREGGAEE